MKKQVLIALLLLLTSCLLITGCSDDDDDVVAAAAAQGYLIGYANLYPGVEFYADVFPMTNSNFSIDSVIAFDSTCEIRSDSYWYVYGDNNYQWLWFENSDDTLRYQSGDTATIDFYFNGTMSSINVKLLNYYDDYPQTILPVPNDTLSLGSTINCVWNSVDGADWYGVRARYRKDSAGTQVYTYNYHSLEDTTLSIPGSMNIYNGYYDIYIIAVSGPGENDPINLNANGLLGEIHSYTTYDTNLRTYLGTGDPTPVSGGINAGAEIEDPAKIARDIIDNLKQKDTPERETYTNRNMQ